MPDRQFSVVTTDHSEKIELLENLLTRLKAGESISSVALVVATPNGWEYPYNGRPWEILVGVARLTYRINVLMDEQ